ncbi:hypothetical protein SKAU_G00374170 [Synaphobranchus kaupii]|uniref:Uncharacterized protein n=1 Tax=Synaphobranchus kaupii TaxID=118154 RepID=A0A9Q1EGM7_SYNKA|nr:hypothetical protein SKAU_G00374170 [Synaphobranchus kaupii]
MHKDASLSTRQDKKPQIILDFNFSKEGVDELQLIETVESSCSSRSWEGLPGPNLFPPGEGLQGLLQVQGVQRGGGGQQPVPAQQAHGVGPYHAVQGARRPGAEADWPRRHPPGSPSCRPTGSWSPGT